MPTFLPRLRVSDRNPHLLTTDNSDRPFFLLGDTAWELFHRLTRDEADTYFANRAAKGFNLVCAVVLAEFDGLRTPNAEGHLPLHDLDPRRPNESYFAVVDALIARAAAHGLYVGLLPTWGDKLTAPWGDGPPIFPADDPDLARDYGHFLGSRYRNTSNLLWILGGDRPPCLSGISPSWNHPWDAGWTPETDWRPVWRAMAGGIGRGTDGQALFAYHPQGGPQSSSVYLHDEPWLHINMMQSGHGGGHDVAVWERIERDVRLSPPKPTLDAEPNYEDHPVNPWPVFDPANGYFRDDDVRRQCYRSVFAGGCGVVYGHHAVWQFWDAGRDNINHADRFWHAALDRPGAFQVGFLRRLMDTRTGWERVCDPKMLVGDVGEGRHHRVALHDSGTHTALIYLPESQSPVTLCLDRLSGSPVLRAGWFDPRTGQETPLPGPFAASGTRTFVPPVTDDPLTDWVLIVEAAAE